MKRYNHIQTITTLIAVVLLASACSKEPIGNQEQTPGEPAPLGVQVEVAPQTRSVVTGTAFGNGSQINIILEDAGPTTKYGISQPYEFRKTSDTDPGLWIPTQTEGLLVSELANVFAHYPAELPSGEAKLSDDRSKIEVTLPASRDFGSINDSDFEAFYLRLKATDPDITEIFTCRSEMDLMTGTGTQVTTAQGGTKATTIAMKHALAMVIVYVKKSPSLPFNPAVKAITIQNSGANTPLVQGSFALADNTFTPNNTPASYTRTMSGFSIDAVRYAMLVYPANMAAGGAEMVLTADAESHTMPMPAKTWESGRVYIYNVEISANEAQIGSVTVANWPEWIEKPFELD